MKFLEIELYKNIRFVSTVFFFLLKFTFTLVKLLIFFHYFFFYKFKSIIA